MVLGAILAKPSLLKEVYGFVDADLDSAMVALKSGNKEPLRLWLNRNGIGQSDEILSVVTIAHEKEVIESRIRKVSKKIQAATSFHATGRLAELTDELKGLLEKHEANATKKREASPAKNTAQVPNGTETNRMPEENTTAENSQKEKGEREPLRTGSVPGSQSGVRVQRPSGPTGRPLRTTGPPPHRKDQVGP